MADANQVNSFLPEMQDISRQRELSKLLLQQGMQGDMKGQMVGNIYVPSHPLEGIANVYSAYKGRQIAKEADEKQAQLAELLRKQTLSDIEAYNEAVKGVPEQTTYGAGEEGPTMNVTPAVAPDYNKGMSILMGSRSPQSQDLAKLLLADQIKTHILPEGGTLVRGSLGGTGQTITSGPKQTTDYKNYQSAVEGGYKGSFNDWFMQKEKAKGTNVMVNTENTYGGTLAKGAADSDLALRNAAIAAPEITTKVARNKKILESGNFFSGKGANVQQDMAMYADAIGLGGKDTATKAANTQSLIQGSAETTLNSIKASGLGSGQGFTDKDREFLQDAKSFRITMTKENIKRVLDLEERAAIESAKKWNQRYKQLPKSATQPLGWGEVEVPTAYGQSSVRSEADKIIEGR